MERAFDVQSSLWLEPSDSASQRLACTPQRCAAILAVTLLAAPLCAQDEESLARALEGKSVVVSIDMPGAAVGVDVWPWADSKVDYSELGDRTRRFGTAIEKDSAAMITKVRVRKKEIEIQLDGGGYSGPSSAPYMSTSVRKTQREKDLEADLKVITDPSRKKEVRNQLRDIQDRRRREQVRLKAEAEQARILREAEIRELRLRSGSRFNLRFDDRVPVEAATPEAVMAALNGLAGFGEASAPVSTAAPRPTANPMALQKGMSEQEVEAMFGVPADRSQSEAAGLTIVSSRYEFESGVVTAKFAEGALVSWKMESR